jgi:large subunit ribosomal protein L25
MPQFILQAERRTESETGKGPVGRMRRGGVVPGVVYGLHQEAIAIKVGEHDFETTVRAMQGVGVVDLTMEGEAVPVLVKQVSRHPVTRRPLNIDFYRIDLSKPMTVEVRVILSATPKDIAAEETFVQPLHKLLVEGLPAVVPPSVHVDASRVAAHAPLLVRDVPLPEGVRSLIDETTVVAAIQRAGVEATVEAEAEEGGLEAAVAGADAES